MHNAVMAAIPAILAEVSSGCTPRIVGLTVDQVERMMAAGILREGDPFELIDGVLVWKDRAPADGDTMAHGVRHATVVNRLQVLDHAVEAVGCVLRVQLPVVLSPSSAPEPDLSVAHGTRDSYVTRHPGPADVLLVIEVADHSLAYDRKTKQRLYATAGILRYLLVSLPEERFELYLDPLPAEGRYARRLDHLPGEMLHADLGLAGAIEIEVAAILKR